MNREGRRLMHWGSIFCETDFFGAWTWAKVRPRWYWTLCRCRLFVRIVWRRVDSRVPDRLDWRTAWEVAKVGEGLSRVPIAGRVLEGRTHDAVAWKKGAEA